MNSAIFLREKKPKHIQAEGMSYGGKQCKRRPIQTGISETLQKLKRKGMELKELYRNAEHMSPKRSVLFKIFVPKEYSLGIKKNPKLLFNQIYKKRTLYHVGPHIKKKKMMLISDKI